jgi:sugar lactone lactonase YvrE
MMKTAIPAFASKSAIPLLRFALCAALAGCGGGGDWCDHTHDHWDDPGKPGPVVEKPPPQFTGLALLAGDQCNVCTGSSNGTGSTARFNGAEGIASDQQGNFYLAESSGAMIRKITAQGVVTTVAGSAGQTGSIDGAGTAARFSNPTRVAVDSGGNVYVTDTGNSTIRKISSTGVVTTIAGQPGVCGSRDGNGTQALFCNPKGITIDNSGNLLVADTKNNTIRKISPSGQVITMAGNAGVCDSADGGVAVAHFCQPSDITIDRWNNVYVADTANSTIRMIDPKGMVTTLAGSAGTCGASDGAQGASRLCSPAGVTVDSNDNLYVTDTGNSTIRRIDVNNVTTTVGGVPQQRGIVLGPLPGGLDGPIGITMDTDVSVVLTSHNLVLRLLPPK